MTFTIETGDLFTHPAQALAHGVNCKGVAGAGVAAIMAKRYPLDIEIYKSEARSGRLKPGDALITATGSGKLIIHCASQNRLGKDATVDWLSQSLTKGLGLAVEYGIESVALPLIGGGIGGLAPELARSTIREASDNYPTLAVTLVERP